MTLEKGQKVAFIGSYDLTKTAFFQTIMGEISGDSGTSKWGESVKVAYFPKDFESYFKEETSLLEWLRPHSPNDDESYIRGFLGKMLFL